MVRRRDPADWLIPIMLFIMLLPSALSLAYPIENPSATRTSGTLPAAYLLAAFPLALIVDGIAKVSPGRRGRLVGAGLVASLVEQASPPPVFQNTWGDGLFFVFEKAADAGRFALRLARSVSAMDRKAAGLPETINLRTALHVGPVYRFRDRIIGRPNYIGAHVNRTARIEPITPPGEVYGTHAFAAIAALEAPGEFRCDYVGRIPLAKDFGEFAMYRVQPGRHTDRL
jgi:class 3 adenylate cyclase